MRILLSLSTLKCRSSVCVPFLQRALEVSGSRWVHSGVAKNHKYTFRGTKWHKHNLPDFSFPPPCLWSLNIVNSRVKVCVVVINKHAQRDLLFDKRSRSNCHLTECFWELPWSGVFVAMETDKQCFLSGFKKKKEGSAGRARAIEDEAARCTMNSTIQHLISSSFLPFLSFFSLCLCERLCGASLFIIPSIRPTDGDFLTQRNSDTTINTSLQLYRPTRTWTRNK